MLFLLIIFDQEMKILQRSIQKYKYFCKLNFFAKFQHLTSKTYKTDNFLFLKNKDKTLKTQSLQSQRGLRDTDHLDNK